MALAKKRKRMLAYAGILGGCAILAMSLFTISQFEKAKCTASISMQLVAQNNLDEILAADKEAINNESSQYHAAALYWDDVNQNFLSVTNQNSIAYKATAIPAYAISMATLVAFGLILKHAEKAQEKEDEEVVLG